MTTLANAFWSTEDFASNPSRLEISPAKDNIHPRGGSLHAKYFGEALRTEHSKYMLLIDAGASGLAVLLSIGDAGAIEGNEQIDELLDDVDTDRVILGELRRHGLIEPTRHGYALSEQGNRIYIALAKLR